MPCPRLCRAKPFLLPLGLGAIGLLNAFVFTSHIWLFTLQILAVSKYHACYFFNLILFSLRRRWTPNHFLSMPILASPVIGSIIFLEHQIAKKNKFTWFAPAQGWSLRSGSKPSLSVSLGVKLQWWSPYKAAPTSKLKPAHVKGFAIGSASYSSKFQRWLRCRFLEEKWGNGWNLIDVATVLVGFLGKMWTSTLNVNFLRHWSWGWERLKPGDYFLAYTKNTHMNSWMQNIYILY